MLLKYKVMIPLLGASVVTGITVPLVMKYGKSEGTIQTALDKTSRSIDLAPNKSFESEEVVNYVLNEYAKSDKEQETIDSDSNKREIEKFQEIVKKVKGRQSSVNQRLSKDDRDLLMDFYWMYSEWDPNKVEVSRESGIDTHNPEGINQYQHEFVVDDLDQIQWDEENLVFIKNGSDLENWGWGGWKENPFRHFYTSNGESIWKEKMKKHQNNKEQVEAEIEQDISSWLVSEIERIYRDRSKSK